jgi:hypothetical protein
MKVVSGGISRCRTQVRSQGYRGARKAVQRIATATVPQTDTGRWVEYTKVNGRTFVKELGKIVP